jgi:hypothetical protein
VLSIHFQFSSTPSCFLNRSTNIRSKNDGARNFNHNAAFAERVAATTKSDFPAAIESSIVAATSSGSAPLVQLGNGKELSNAVATASLQMHLRTKHATPPTISRRLIHLTVSTSIPHNCRQTQISTNISRANDMNRYIT